MSISSNFEVILLQFLEELQKTINNKPLYKKNICFDIQGKCDEKEFCPPLIQIFYNEEISEYQLHYLITGKEDELDKHGVMQTYSYHNGVIEFELCDLNKCSLTPLVNTISSLVANDGIFELPDVNEPFIPSQMQIHINGNITKTHNF